MDLIKRQGEQDSVLVSSDCGELVMMLLLILFLLLLLLLILLLLLLLLIILLLLLLLQVATHSLLLSLHSSLLAALLKEHVWRQGVTLPLSLPAIKGLVSLLHGQEAVRGVKEQEVKEAAEILGIPWQGLGATSLGHLGHVRLDTQDLNIQLKSVPNPLIHKDIDSDAVKYEGINVNDDSFDSGSLEEDNKPNLVGKDMKSKHAKSGKKSNRILSKLTNKGSKIVRKRVNKDFPCDECKLGFSSDRFLMRHKLKAHNITMMCEKCNEKFSAYHAFKKHFMENHPSYTCPVCGISKFNKTSLSNHMESKHETNIPCPQCGVMYTTKANLNVHIGRVHSDKELQKCPKCDFKTRMAYEVKGHFIRMHTENTKETCQFCGEVFKHLKNHHRRTGCDGKVVVRKKLSCNQCDKEFAWNSILAKHVKEIHSGIKDKTCPHCSYATYSGSNLRLHVSKMHFGTKVVKLLCPHCEKPTSNLKYHTDIDHPLLSGNSTFHKTRPTKYEKVITLPCA